MSDELDRVADDIANVTRFELNDFSSTLASSEQASLELPGDIDSDLRIELGRTQLYLDDVLKLRQGAVVTLDRGTDDLVDVYANDRLIARGEVLVMNDRFCVRVAEMISVDAASG